MPALEVVEADAEFEEEALAAWEEYQLTGLQVAAKEIDVMFSDALARARSVAANQ